VQGEQGRGSRCAKGRRPRGVSVGVRVRDANDRVVAYGGRKRGSGWICLFWRGAGRLTRWQAEMDRE
jgi:hypothetical protein